MGRVEATLSRADAVGLSCRKVVCVAWLMPVAVLMSGNIHLGLGRVCDCVPGAVGRSRLSTSCVRQRSRSRGVRRSNTALFSCASRWGCWMIESCRPETATLSRTGQVASELTDSSPMRRAFDHELDCCYLRELSQTCLNPARDSFACPVRSVDCGSLPGRLGAIVTTFQRWAVRGEVSSPCVTSLGTEVVVQRVLVAVSVPATSRNDSGRMVIVCSEALAPMVLVRW